MQEFPFGFILNTSSGKESNNMNILRVKNISKTYSTRFSNIKTEALKDINFEIEKGEFIAIMGESGSGKTTLLNIISCIDKPSGGKLFINGKDVGQSENLAKFRRENIGFVFQDFNLLNTLSVEDNILLPLVLSDFDINEAKHRLKEIAESINILSLLKKYPYEISGGQKQRVAVARALITKPSLILADEPTGALDTKSSRELFEVFKQIHEQGNTILMVTHSITAASKAERVMFIKDGIIFHQLYKGDMSDEAMYLKISDSLNTIIKAGA